MVDAALRVEAVVGLGNADRLTDDLEVEWFAGADNSELYGRADGAANRGHRGVNREALRGLTVNRDDLVAGLDTRGHCGSSLQRRDDRQNVIFDINLHANASEAAGDAFGKLLSFHWREIDGVWVAIGGGEAFYRTIHPVFDGG